MLRHGAHPDAPNSANETPLLWAATRGMPDLVTSLLAAGADPNRQSDSVRCGVLLLSLSVHFCRCRASRRLWPHARRCERSVRALLAAGARAAARTATQRSTVDAVCDAVRDRRTNAAQPDGAAFTPEQLAAANTILRLVRDAQEQERQRAAAAAAELLQENTGSVTDRADAAAAVKATGRARRRKSKAQGAVAGAEGTQSVEGTAAGATAAPDAASQSDAVAVDASDAVSSSDATEPLLPAIDKHDAALLARHKAEARRTYTGRKPTVWTARSAAAAAAAAADADEVAAVAGTLLGRQPLQPSRLNRGSAAATTAAKQPQQ